MRKKSEDCEQKLEGVRLTPARKKGAGTVGQTPCASLKGAVLLRRNHPTDAG